MISLSRMLSSWRSPRYEKSPVCDFTNDPALLSPTDQSPIGSQRDRLTFWRRLMCVPEVFDPHVERSPFPAAASLLSSDSETRPKPAPLRPLSRTTGSATKPQSVFSKHAPALSEKAKGVQAAGERGPHPPGLPGLSPKASSTRWALTDTRRMARVESDGPIGFCERLEALRKARAQQLKDEPRKLRERQRKEAEEEREEQRRLSCDFKRTGNDVSGATASLGECDEVSYSDAKSIMDGALKTSLNTSFADSESASILDGEDAMDLNDLNHLYEHYKRREVSLRKAQPPQEDQQQNEVSKNTQSRKNFPKYSLQSKQYIERVILGQRSQQVIALMWLLAESMRHAWKLNLRLAQLYWYYVPHYLQTFISADGKVIDEDTISIMNDKYYRYFLSSDFDYQCFIYQFSHEWDELFTSVQYYLGDSSSLSAPAGSVGVAATILHSMELFGRQCELQASIRRVEAWLERSRQRMEEHQRHSTAYDDSAKTVIEPFAVSEESQPPVESALEQTVSSTTEVVNREDEKNAFYVPMNWHMALDDNLRANVCWTRKKHKLRHLRVAMQTHHSTLRQTKASAGEPYAERSPTELGLVPLEGLSEETSEEEMQSPHIVSVGCFGFSFLSRWE